jgi:hypothetical protein
MKPILLASLFLCLTACATTSEEIGGDPAKKADCYEKYALEISLHQGQAISELQDAYSRQKAALSMGSKSGDFSQQWDAAEASLKKANGMRKLFKVCLENAGVDFPKK